MKKIADIVDRIEEEIESAKEYAEMYVDRKARSDSQWSQRFKEMANDELKHATYLHDHAVEEIDVLATVFNPTAEMQEVWDMAHRNFVEKVAWVKQMLSM